MCMGPWPYISPEFTLEAPSLTLQSWDPVSELWKAVANGLPRVLSAITSGLFPTLPFENQRRCQIFLGSAELVLWIGPSPRRQALGSPASRAFSRRECGIFPAAPRRGAGGWRFLRCRERRSGVTPGWKGLPGHSEPGAELQLLTLMPPP